MKWTAALFALSLSAAHAATAPELKLLGETQFSAGIAAPKIVSKLTPLPRPKPPLPGLEKPLLPLFEPNPQPVKLLDATGEEVARVSLASRLDAHRDLETKQLGNSVWNISIAGDASYKKYFFTFQQAPKLRIKLVEDLNRLRSQDGIDVEIEPGLVYNFHVSINFLNPIRGSTLEITPAGTTQGPPHEINSGDLLDAIKAKSFVFNADGVEYWMLYGTDVNAQTETLGNTRSLLFIHFANMSTKAWPLPESSLPAGQPTTVTFGDNRLVLTRTASGDLVVQRAN